MALSHYDRPAVVKVTVTTIKKKTKCKKGKKKMITSQGSALASILSYMYILIVHNGAFHL